MLDIHSSLHINNCYRARHNDLTKGSLQDQYSHRLPAWNICKANFQSCENNVAHVQNHQILHNITVKGIGESAVD